MSEDETIWNLKEHTAAKHELLRRYLDAWIPILSQGRFGSRRLLFIDGFAGPGIYKGGEPGSPIVAMQAVADAGAYAGNVDFQFLFVEFEPERVDSLNEQIDWFRANVNPLPNVNTIVEPGSFPDVADLILSELEESRRQMAPTLSMIDPFGFKAAPMGLIARLMQFPRCEVLFNFMLDSVNRHVGNHMVAEHMEQLFGCTEFVDVPEAGDPYRRPFLTDLYGRQLCEAAGASHVSRFDLVNDRGRPNALFHATSHIKGLEMMRRTMWDRDPIEGTRFDARRNPETPLFVGEPDYEPLRNAIVNEFAGHTVTVEQIHGWVLTDTTYDPTRHLKKHALKIIEDEGGADSWIAEVTKADGSLRRRGTFPKGCTIRFAQ